MVRARLYPLASQVPNAQGVPVADTRILLLGNAGSEALNKILGKPGRTMTRIEDAEQFVKAAPDHDVVVLDAVPPPRTVADLCRELSALPDLVEVPILAITSIDFSVCSGRSPRHSAARRTLNHAESAFAPWIVSVYVFSPYAGICSAANATTLFSTRVCGVSSP